PPPPPPPPLTCHLAVSPAAGSAPLSVTASGSCSDANHDAFSALLDFGDGFYLSASATGHAYTHPGVFKLSLVARDQSGNTSAPVSHTVTVTANPTLFVGISGGKIAEFNKSGARLRTLDSRQGGSVTGMAFDSAGKLYATNFTADTVSKFDSSGALLGTFGSGYNCKPESIVFDSSGDAFVGETGCSHALLRFDAYGNLSAGYSVATEQQGSDWIDIAPDGCTLFYTSQGASVLRFDSCRRQQLAPFSSSLREGLALRLLPDGGALVANLDNIVRLDSAGRLIQTYVASGEKCWASLALDNDASSFWAADYCTSDVVRFDITSGNSLFRFNTGTPANTVFGLAVRPLAAAQPAPAGPLVASAASATISAGQSASYAVNFTPLPGVAGQTLSFSCADLPLGANCSFSPANVTASNGTATVNLTITTAAGSSAALNLGGANLLYALCLPLSLLAIPAGGRPRNRTWFVVLLLIALLALFACGGVTAPAHAPAGNNVPAAPRAGTSTPSGSYTVLVRAHGGAWESSTAVQLIVK
ncbi:MAG TPA: PKD domain-containing protein, partial [Terriglobales bacterium]|nr:PKD domain-containing protein [Terriglobales bacterium]